MLGFIRPVPCRLTKLSIAQFQLLVDAALAGRARDGHHCQVKARGQPSWEADPSDDVVIVVQANTSAVLNPGQGMTPSSSTTQKNYIGLPIFMAIELFIYSTFFHSHTYTPMQRQTHNQLKHYIDIYNSLSHTLMIFVSQRTRTVINLYTCLSINLHTKSIFDLISFVHLFV